MSKFLRNPDVIAMVLLGAIWGSSFTFMRLVVPVLGIAPTAFLRIMLAGLVLIPFVVLTKKSFRLGQNWKHYWIIGIFNSALPFLCYSYAALHIPAGISVILNSTTPIFGLALSVFFLNERITRRKVAGLLLGTIGVCFIAFQKNMSISASAGPAIAAGTLAALCYAIAAVYYKKKISETPPLVLSATSLIFGGLSLLPFAANHWISNPMTADHWTGTVIFSIGMLAIVCSGLAYLIYYRLVARIGPTRALTVTYLMPMFGILWGYLFLDEPVNSTMIIGSVFILAGIRASVNPEPRDRPET